MTPRQRYLTDDGRTMIEVAPHQFVDRRWLIANGVVVERVMSKDEVFAGAENQQ